MSDERALNNFISQIKKEGLARTSRFNVIITPPDKSLISTSTAGFDNNRLILLCDKFDIPNLSLATNDIQMYGEVRSMPYQKIFDKVNMSFYVDTDMNVKKFFDKWAQLIINPTSRFQSYYDQYITQVDVIINDVAEKAVYRVSLHECYPTMIGGINLDYANKDVMKLNVTMTYKYYTVSEFTDSSNYDFSKPIDISQLKTSLLTSVQAPLDIYNRPINVVQSAVRTRLIQ